jgi:hypothetical protein
MADDTDTTKSQSQSSTLKDGVKAAEKYAKPVIEALTKITPYVITYSSKAWKFYKSLPADHLHLIIGFIFCFFGGVYPALFGAIEAAKHGGIETVVSAFSDLSDEAIKIIEASKKDDDKDDDGDGKKDVSQISTNEYLVRKANLVMTKLNPEKIDKAMASIYKVWLSVIAVLTVQFAQTIALSVSISDFLRKPADHYVSPTLKSIVPEGYHKWVPVALGWMTKAFAMSIAWYMNAVITAFTSALIGALMISRALLKLANKHEMTLGGLLPKNHEDTYIDEAVSYVFALFGFYFQFKMNFDVPFPFNILLFPLGMGEYFVRWSVTK